MEDREMKAFISKPEAETYFFYPFIDDIKITEEYLKNTFPKTYTHIKRFENKLKLRNEVKKGNLAWWMPNRPR